MQPLQLLHLLNPYVPTDRFRALLRNSDLAASSEGAALMVDISGFTPMTTQLVVDYGPERASEELKRRLNPMFEAVAGVVFHHGGSVIRFTGDGFIAWFDDRHIDQAIEGGLGLPGALRAVAAGIEMQITMRFFKGLRLKVCLGGGTSYRWAVGNPQYGLLDLLLGPAVDDMIALGGLTQPGQVVVHESLMAWFRNEQITLQTVNEHPHGIVTAIPDLISQAARHHRWMPWSVQSDLTEILNAVRPFIDSAIRDRVENGLGDFVAELRYGIPMFVKIASVSPELPDARATLDSYVRAAQGILATFGGRLVSVEVSDKGSVLFAVFGAPTSYGDDAERAVRAAIALRDSADGPNGTGAERIGLSRGMLYAGTVGGEVRHEYSTIGDETNLAARLMSAALYKQVLVSSAVRKAVGEHIQFRELPDLYVKGREYAIGVTEPMSVKNISYIQQHATQLVGRDEELKQLRRSVQAVQRGYPRILQLEGPAGIGKSRLVAELVTISSGQGFLVAGGDCISTGRNMPYLPWRDVFMTILGLNVDAAQDENITRLNDFVQKMNPEWLPRVPLLGDLLKFQIPDTPRTAILQGKMRSQALFALVTDIVMVLARQQPVMIVLEDTHWLDEVSEALAIDLARRMTIEQVPLLLLMAHRPLLDSDHPRQIINAIKDMHIHNAVVLDELSKPAVMEVLESYLNASIPDELGEFVFERARGNPFYVQEVVDTLIETGHLEVIANVGFINGDLQKANIPQTIQNLVQARIDRLSEMDRLVLKVAAVIGREFPVRILAKSIPVQMEYDELLGRLRTLEERDFSYLETPEPDLTYLFKHAITQEVTYANLLFAQRSQLHQAVALALESIAPEATERLAFHFARSGDEDRARYYLKQAGEKAFREYANQAAFGYFTWALDLALDDEEWFEINRRRLDVMLRVGDVQNVKIELKKMEELATRYKRGDWLSIVHIFWASFYTQTSAWPQVIAEAQKAVQYAQKLGHDQFMWEAYRLQRGGFRGINQQEEAEHLYEVMQPIAVRLVNQHRSVELSLMRVEDLYLQDPQQAIGGAQVALAQALALEDLILQADCWKVLASLYSRENDLAGAFNSYRSLIDLLRIIGDRRHEGLAMLNLGLTVVALGDLSEGNNYLLDAYKILRQVGERAGEANSLVGLGLVAYHHGAYDESLAYLNRGLSLQHELHAEADAGKTLFYIANTHIMREKYSDAMNGLDEARVLFEANSMFLHIGELYTALGDVHLRQGDLELALPCVFGMLERLERGKVSDLLAPGLTYWRVVEILTRVGELDRAAALRATFRAQAERILGKIDARYRHLFTTKIWYQGALLAEQSVPAPQPAPEENHLPFSATDD